jgi:hypothetical protein
MPSLSRVGAEIPRGHRVERMPVEPTSPFVPAGLHETDLITPAGVINRSTLMRIATYRARRELEAYAAMGAPRPRSELLGEELRRTWSIAKVMLECEAGRRAFARMPPAERHIRQLELRLEKLRRGLATPSCAKTQDDIAHYETLLARARVAIAEAAE